MKEQFLWKFGILNLGAKRQAQSDRAPWAMLDVTDYSGRWLLNIG